MFILHRFESFTLPSFLCLLTFSTICFLFVEFYSVFHTSVIYSVFRSANTHLANVCAQSIVIGDPSLKPVVVMRNQILLWVRGSIEQTMATRRTGETKEYIQRDCLLVECVLPINYSSCVRQPGKCLCYGILSTRNVSLGRREIVPINLIRSELPRRWDPNPILAEI